jgi:hypothetical protein
VQAASIAKESPAIEVLCRGASQITSAIGNVIICGSEQTPDSRYLEDYVQAINAYGKNHPTGLGMLVLIAAAEPPPDDRARHDIHNSHLAIKGCVRLAVLVVEGEGFAASAKRSIIAMLSMSPNTAFPTKVAADIREGVTKLMKVLGPQLAPQLDVDSIATAATQVRDGMRIRLH